VVSELEYQLNSGMYEGSFTLPLSMSYRSISGTKSISTASGYNDSTKEGYLGALIISVYDSEGSVEDFIIVLLISGSTLDLDLTTIIIFSVIGLLAISSVSIYFIRRRKTRGITYTPTPYGDYQYRPYGTEEDSGYITPIMEDQIEYALYCGFCGKGIKNPKKFCPHCGESVELL